MLYFTPFVVNRKKFKLFFLFIWINTVRPYWTIFVLIVYALCPDNIRFDRFFVSISDKFFTENFSSRHVFSYLRATALNPDNSRTVSRGEVRTCDGLYSGNSGLNF